MQRKKIAIIGANGHIGTELCFLFQKESEFEIVPVVRNTIGAAFLTFHGFNCRIADICNKKDAKDNLNDVDAIVITAYSRLEGTKGTAINELMIENSVDYSKPDCKIIYFSTIRAFSSAVDSATPKIAIPRMYDKSKRNLERFLQRSCEKARKKYYAFRLGHVFGENQPRTRILKELISKNKVLRLQVNKDMPSNIVHTVTIAEAIKICITTNLESGIYSVANHPQWSWDKVFNYYNHAGTRVEFEGLKSKKNLFDSRRILNVIWKYLPRSRIMGIKLYLPEKIIEKSQTISKVRSYKRVIANWEESQKQNIDMGEFRYRPMPGPFIPGLSSTKSLLAEYDLHENIFSPTMTPKLRI